MIQRVILSVFLAFLMPVIPFLNTPAMAAQSPLGIWMDHSGRGAIQISSCGDKLCGHLVWMRESGDAEGCGVQIIGEARKVRDDLWDDGWIYSPEKNRKYNVELKPLSNGTLRVKGYAGSKMFSRTMIWKPAPDNLELCLNKTREPNDAVKQEKPETPYKEKIAKADPSRPTGEEKQIQNPSFYKSQGGPFTETEESSGSEQQTQKSTDPIPKTSPKVDRMEKNSPLTKTEPSLDEPKYQDKKTKTRTAQSNFSSGSINKTLSNLQRETGFGIKKIGNGACSLKVPFVTIRIRCDD